MRFIRPGLVLLLVLAFSGGTAAVGSAVESECTAQAAGGRPVCGDGICQPRETSRNPGSLTRNRCPEDCEIIQQ